MAYTVTQLTEIGGTEWQKGDMHRVYFNSLTGWYGLDYALYNTGNVSSATLDGDKISNGRARELIGKLGSAKLWYDMTDNKFHGKGVGQQPFTNIVTNIKAKI